MKKIRVKARVVPQPCMFRDTCSGACEWCETHIYSEACVPFLQREVRKQQECAASVRRRLQHLLQSKLIASFDKVKLRSGEYGRDIREADMLYLAAYNILTSKTTCNTCAKAGCCEYVSWGENVVYGCPHYEKRGGA